MSDLDPLSPEEGVRLYLDAKKDDLAAETLKSQEYRLNAFVQWCNEEGIENLNELSGRDVYAYRVWRREGQGEGRESVAPITLRGQLATARAFLRFCGDIEAVPPDLYDRVPLPTLSNGEEVSDSTLDPDHVAAILDYLSQFKYATRDHLIVLLGWHTGARLGGLRGLDLGDVDLDGDHPRVSGPAVHFVHRPETGTPLKNKDKSTRWNRISEYVAEVIRDYLKETRDDVTDEYGREPLFTTRNGRPVPSTIRESLYRVTRPCWRNEPCPHDRDIEDCEATNIQKATRCPSSRSPHDLRSGRVTFYRRQNVPRRIVEDRLNASENILDKHYDRRSEPEKAEQRSEYLPDF
ncbi:tyrosine-type recombinase/integrase [Haloplanus rubicundus]|uniref:Site-specific integrase n=1 Tax=Haloplanus rubicundus TaxID=1547898 RepID=A0A345E8X5_9EURY|nr:tyrosine-type recombinase/integrase [Haloplanus rubicundus]AXG08647.1 site-specific integrase [Haloplanus rubicundus]